MKFTRMVKVTGGLVSSYVFENDSEVNRWLKFDYPLIRDSYPDLEYHISELDGLVVGDSCHVVGEGMDIFVIDDVYEISPHKYGFTFTDGDAEEVAKCYKVAQKEQSVDLKKESIKELLARIESKKNIIAQKRNELRELADELNDLLESLDSGIEDLEHGKQTIESGLDTLSEYL